jgi:hypothetical protein
VSFPHSGDSGSLILILVLVWLLRNDIGEEYESLLRKLSQLAPLADIQVRVFFGGVGQSWVVIRLTGGRAIVTGETNTP